MSVHSRYQDIASDIRERIENAEWPPGATLPTLDELATAYAANRNTVARAVGLLETEGYLWAVPRRGITVRYGMGRNRRPRGNLVKRNAQTLGYSFPSASSQEVWKRHGLAHNTPAALTDPRIAKYLGVEPGTVVPRRFRVTGPVGEPPFQINTSWIRPEFADIVAQVDADPKAGEWLYLIEQAGHWPISWVEFHRARMPSKTEAGLLEIPETLPVLEIVRQGISGGDGRPVEVTEYVLASDRVETVMVLERDTSAKQPWGER